MTLSVLNNLLQINQNKKEAFFAKSAAKPGDHVLESLAAQRRRDAQLRRMQTAPRQDYLLNRIGRTLAKGLGIRRDFSANEASFVAPAAPNVSSLNQSKTLSAPGGASGASLSRQSKTLNAPAARDNSPAGQANSPANKQPVKISVQPKTKFQRDAAALTQLLSRFDAADSSNSLVEFVPVADDDAKESIVFPPNSPAGIGIQNSEAISALLGLPNNSNWARMGDSPAGIDSQNPEAIPALLGLPNNYNWDRVGDYSILRNPRHRRFIYFNNNQ